MRDALPDLIKRGIFAIGVSPDTPQTQKKFDTKHGLGFPLLADSDHIISEAYGVRGEKKMYGKTFMGIVRSAFLIDEEGRIFWAKYKISPDKTIPELITSLGS